MLNRNRERCFVILQELVNELRLAQLAILSSSPQQIEIHTTRQEQQCRALACDQDESGHCHEPANATALSLELETLAREARQLNRINAALLRRQQRWLRAVLGLRQRSRPEGTYLSPRPQGSVVSPPI